jgi:hypothetical protein
MRALPKLILFMTLTVGLSAAPAATPEACPCVPITHLWTAVTCETWDCAAAALAVAAGDPYTFAYPSGDPAHPWIVMRRLASGTSGDSGNDPFKVDMYDDFTGAAVAYMGIDHEMRPMLLSSPDGRMLVLSLREAPVPKRRASTH